MARLSNVIGFAKAHGLKRRVSRREGRPDFMVTEWSDTPASERPSKVPFAVWFVGANPRDAGALVEPVEKRPHQLSGLVHHPVLLRPHALVGNDPI